MRFVIDCYNLLRSPMPPGLAGLDEAGLVRALVRSRLGRRGVRIVCDGKAKPGVPAGRWAEGVTLSYAGAGRSADDVILDLIARDTAPRRLAVVSDDRALRRAARRRRAEAVSCAEFIHLLQSPMPDAPPPRAEASAGPSTTAPPGHEALDYWAQQFGVDPGAGLDDALDESEDDHRLT